METKIWVRLQIATAALLIIQVLWDVKLCHGVSGSIHFKGQGVNEEFSHPSNLEVWKHCITMKMSGKTKPATVSHARSPEYWTQRFITMSTTACHLSRSQPTVIQSTQLRHTHTHTDTLQFSTWSRKLGGIHCVSKHSYLKAPSPWCIYKDCYHQNVQPHKLSFKVLSLHSIQNNFMQHTQFLLIPNKFNYDQFWQSVQ